MKVVSKVAFKRKMEATDKKLSVLEVIDKEKDVLFAPLKSNNTNAYKVRGWKTVLQKAKSVGLVKQNRDWRFLRDKVFSVWKSRTLTKRENIIKSGSAGCATKLDKVDLKILDILALDLGQEWQECKESPDVDENSGNSTVTTATEPKNRTQIIKQIIPHYAVDEEIPQTSTKEVNQNPTNLKRISERDLDEYFEEKRKLTLELLNHDIYLKKLQALKLERELGLIRSEYTQELEEITDIKKEITSDMDFEDNMPHDYLNSVQCLKD